MTATRNGQGTLSAYQQAIAILPKHKAATAAANLALELIELNQPGGGGKDDVFRPGDAKGKADSIRGLESYLRLLNELRKEVSS